MAHIATSLARFCASYGLTWWMIS